MWLFQLLFSFRGRITRSQYWLGGAIQMVLCITLLGGYFAIVGTTFNKDFVDSLKPGSPALKALAPLLIPPVLIVCGLLFTAAAIYTKRLHDRNKGAIWLLAIYGPALGGLVIPPLFFVGIISNIWVFIELGCMAGTAGPNRFDDGPNKGAFLDETFGKIDESAPRGVGGMEAALAAINAAARNQGASGGQSNAPQPRAQQSTYNSFGEPAAQFGKRAAPAYGSFNAAGGSGGGFGRRL